MSGTNVGNQVRLANTLTRRIPARVEELLEKDRVEKALQNSERRYPRPYESAREGIMIFDADMGESILY